MNYPIGTGYSGPPQHKFDRSLPRGAQLDVGKESVFVITVQKIVNLLAIIFRSLA